jgi:hypothetical protein
MCGLHDRLMAHGKQAACFFHLLCRCRVATASSCHTPVPAGTPRFPKRPTPCPAGSTAGTALKPVLTFPLCLRWQWLLALALTCPRSSPCALLMTYFIFPKCQEER